MLETKLKQNMLWAKFLLGFTLLATIIGALFSTQIFSRLESKAAQAKEAARPANIKIIKITAPNCSDCFDVNAKITALKQQNVIVTEEKALEFDSNEAQTLIKQFAIKKVPTYVAVGEIAKDNIKNYISSNGEIKNDTFIFTNVVPVYINPESQQEVGRVIATLLTDTSCAACIDPKLTIDRLKELGVNIAEQKNIAWNSTEGQQIIEKYKITKLPTFLLSPEIDAYDSIKNSWQQLGTIEEDKTYIVRNVLLPYRDLEKRQVLGLVDIVYVTDKTCPDCYQPEQLQKNILTKTFGIGLSSERIVDSNSPEGKSLISKYKLTAVPTILLSGNVSQYTNLENVWKDVGTVEPDGWYVFRQMQQLGQVVYRDVTNNTIVRPSVEPAASNNTNQ